MKKQASNSRASKQLALDPAAVESVKRVIQAIAPMQASDFDILMSILEPVDISKGDFLSKEGEVSDHIFFLINGLMRMYYIDHAGSEINYRFTMKDTFLVDFQSVLTRKPSHFYWQAMEDSTLFALPYDKVQQAYNSSSAWIRFGKLMAEHVYLQLNERVEMLLFMTPEQRYLHLLATNPTLFERVSQFHLSSYMGIKPESLSRLRKRLMKNHRS